MVLRQVFEQIGNHKFKWEVGEWEGGRVGSWEGEKVGGWEVGLSR